MTIAHSVSLKQLAIWVLLMTVVLHLLASIPYGYYNWHAIDQWAFNTPKAAYQTYGYTGPLMMISNSIFSPLVHFQRTPAGFNPSLIGTMPWLPSFFDMLVGLLLATGFATIWSAVLLAVPVTRRIAKIQVKHIARAFLLSILAGMVLFQACRVESIYYNVATVTPSILFLTTIYVTILWLIVFWISAIRIGWRIRPSLLLIILGTIAALLGMFTFVAIPAMHWTLR